MFCPKCAAQNVDGASFCRVCGANVSLVLQALSGQLPAAENDTLDARRRRKRGGRKASLEGAIPTRKASLDGAIPTFCTGLAFLAVSLVLAFSAMGNGWWFWMLIPAFSCLGSGIAQYIKYRELRDKFPQSPVSTQSSLDARTSVALPTRNTGELMQPPASVTEGTTRHLGAEAPTRHLDS